MSITLQGQWDSVDAVIAALTEADRFPLFMLATETGKALSGRHTRAMYERLRALGIVVLVSSAPEVYQVTPFGRQVVERLSSQGEGRP